MGDYGKTRAAAAAVTQKHGQALAGLEDEPMINLIETTPEAVERLAETHDTVGNAPDKYIMGHPHHWKTAATLRAMSDRIAELEAAIRRQAAASKTLRQSTLSEVQHIKDSERKEYVATKTLDSERDANAILTEENEALSTRIAELEAENKQINMQLDVIEEMGTESLNALPDCLMRLAPALVENGKLKAHLAKAMEVVEMLASADVDAVLGQAVDISCEILGELMEDEDDE